MLYILYCLVIFALVGLDQITKYLIVENFTLGQSKVIINNFFSITYIQNYGAGFSILQNETIFLVCISLFAIGVLLYLLIKTNSNETFNRISYLLIISGSIGNLLDRIRLSYVVDFLDFLIINYDFPIFNVADCFITIGCFMLIFSIIKEGKNAKN